MISIKQFSLFMVLLALGWTACNPTTTLPAQISFQTHEDQRIVPTMTQAETLRMQYALQCQTVSGLPEWPKKSFDTLSWLIDHTTYKNFFMPNDKEKAPRYSHLDKVLQKIDFVDYLTKNDKFVDSTGQVKYTLMYIWPKSLTSTSNKKPFMFMAHQDVVPVAILDESSWDHGAFYGLIRPDKDDNKVNAFYGRGAIDNKGNVMSILEAVERLAAEGFKPDRDLIFIFEHDEEGKATGAQAVVQYLNLKYNKDKSNKTPFAEMLMDEGGSVVTNLLTGLPISAVIGTAEKGFVTIGISAARQGGHASMPEDNNSIMLTANALKRVYDRDPKYKFDNSTDLFFKYMGPEIQNERIKFLFSKPNEHIKEIADTLRKNVKTHAMIHTSMAPTVFEAGNAGSTNVVPTFVTAYMNFRMVPGDNASNVFDNVKSLIKNAQADTSLAPQDNLLKVFIKDSRYTNPTESKIPDGEGYKLVSKMVKRTFNDIPTSPFLMIGATDSRYFTGLAEHFIKFSPVKDPQGFHTYNERIKVEDYRHSIWFYQQLISEGKCLECDNSIKPKPAKKQ